MRWRGGRLQEVMKKGSPQICNNFRGILVSNHASKVLPAILHVKMNDAYTLRVGSNQYGAVAKRGTATASHTVRTFLDIARLLGRSVGLLFVDFAQSL